MFNTRKKCFYCDKKIAKNKDYKVTLNTLEGRLDLIMCDTCAKDFDQIMKELETVVNERPHTI